MTSHCQSIIPSHRQWSWACEEKHSGEKKQWVSQEVQGQVVWAPALQEDFWVTKAQWGCSLCQKGQLWLLLQLLQEERSAKASSTSSSRFVQERSKFCLSCVHWYFLKEIILTIYNWESTCYIGKTVLVQEHSHSFCTQGQGGGLFYEFSVC